MKTMLKASKTKPKAHLKVAARPAPKPKAKPQPKPKPKEKAVTNKDDDKFSTDRGPQTDGPQHGKTEPHQPHEANHIANRDQDPNHPANTTLSPHRDPSPRPEAEAFNIPPEDLLTEQEKDAAIGGPATEDNVPGVGPAPSS